MHRSRCFLALAAAALLLLLPVEGARAAASGNESTMAREIAEMINDERAQRGLSRIPYDADYSTGAQRVAESNRDSPCHACHSSGHPSGEVVWWGSDYPSSGSPIWWMNSPSHRSLLLAPTATRIGVGVACNGTEHDAVAWIETPAGAQNQPAKPIVTSASSGSRCRGISATATTRGASAPTPTTAAAARGAAPTTTRATLVAAATGDGGARRTTTTRRTQQSAAGRATGSSDDDDGSPADVATAAAPFVEVNAASASRGLASVSRPLGGTNGMGPAGILLLLLTFVGVLVLGHYTHRRQPVRP